MVSFEEREGKAGSDKAKILTAEFKHVFKNLLIAFHPDIPGEVKANLPTPLGGKIAKQELIDKQKKILIMPRLLLMMLMLYYTRNIFLT